MPAATGRQRQERTGQPRPCAPSGVVVVISRAAERAYARSHERATRDAVAGRLAALLGLAFAGEHDPGAHRSLPLYLIPADSLHATEAERLGVRGEGDLFGGGVPHPFIGTKAITHPLVADDARAPEGWSREFGRRVREAVLDGFTVFGPEDAYRAGRRLLERGPVRIKPVRARGGGGGGGGAGGAAAGGGGGAGAPAGGRAGGPPAGGGA